LWYTISERYRLWYKRLGVCRGVIVAFPLSLHCFGSKGSGVRISPLRPTKSITYELLSWRAPQKPPQKRTANGRSPHRLGGPRVFGPNVNSALVRIVRFPFTFSKLRRCSSQCFETRRNQAACKSRLLRASLHLLASGLTPIGRTISPSLLRLTRTIQHPCSCGRHAAAPSSWLTSGCL